jgi:outer membrane receptor protein involved in Fe transport
MKLTSRHYLLIVFVLSNLSLFSQSASITGKLVDSEKNQAIQGASINIYAINKSTVSDSKGEFTLRNIKNGYHILTIKKQGYRLITFDSLFIENGKDVDLGEIVLEEKVETFKKGTVIYRKKKTTDAAAVEDQKKSEVVINVVGAEQIEKSNDGDAAKVAARVPGVTLMENRFIMLRGLSQRYNSVQINNINAPSTEVDRRAFSFDLVPSNMLDKMSVYKSPSSDIAGDFAGGVIKLTTKSEIGKNFVSYSMGLGYRLNTTFSTQQNNSVGSNTDILGFDNGNRALPDGFPSTLAGNSTAQNVALGKTFKNNYSLSDYKTPLDFGIGIGFGQNIKIKKMNLYTVNNFGYSTNFQYAKMKRFRFQNDPDPEVYVREMFNYTDDNFAIESKFNILSNWILEVNKKNMFSFKNIFNQIGENETTIRTGVNPTERPNDEWKNYAFHYTSRSLYFGQFEGAHKFGKKQKISYTLGYSNVNRNEPDFRRFRSVRSIGSGDQFTIVDPPAASLFDAARFYSTLKENTGAVSVDYENHYARDTVQKKDFIFRAGAYTESKSRTFSARWLSYKYTGNPAIKDAFLKTPFDQIFSGDNINTTGGFKPEEGTNPSDRYDAQNNLIAAYVNGSFPFSNFNVNAGVRAEAFNQYLQSKTQSSDIDVTLENFNILPSLNISYNFDKRNLVRIAYGKTVNRPEFRELAPFVYYDFMYDVNIVGNPNLKSATIDNLDLRFERYPAKGQTVSLGVFYKKFINPIENYVQPIGLSQQFFLNNAASATNMGAEIELRKSFENSTQNNFFKYLSIILNASYIISEVDLGADSTLSQAQKRPLQGQSPYIVNTAIQYQNDSGLSVNVAYNIFGKRIAYVGNNIFPTVYEMPRHSLDITISKELTERLKIKFGVSDVLNFKHQLWQDTNGDGIIDYKKNRTDNQLLEYRRGQVFTFGISYKIEK